jgi:hypothetical protein
VTLGGEVTVKARNKMSKKYKKILHSISICVYITFLYNLFFGHLDIYKFAILKEKYPNYFTEQYRNKKLNLGYYPLNKIVDNYSPKTDIVVDDIIKDKNEREHFSIEHAATIIEEDTILIPALKNNDFPNYLFIGVEIPFENVTEISITNSYNGKELEEFGTFIIQYKKDPEEKLIYPEIEEVKDISHNKNLIPVEGNFLYVRIYKFPEDKRSKLYTMFVPKKFWFSQGIEQKLKLKYINSNNIQMEVDYEFKLDWVKWMSIFDQIASVT